MNRMDFSQAVIRIKVLEKRLLSRARLERMVDAKDMDEVFRILGETEYQQHLNNVARPEDYENILSAELRRVYKLMDELTGEKIITKLLSLKYDYHNLKVLVKERVLGKSLSSLYVPYGTEDLTKLKAAMSQEDFSDLDKRIGEALQETVAEYEKSGDPQMIDIVLDRHYYRHLRALADETDIPMFQEFVKNQVDFTNMKTLIRVKKMDKEMKFLEEVLLDGGAIDRDKILYSINDTLDGILDKFRKEDIGKPLTEGLEAFRRTGRLSDFEKIIDNRLMEINEPSRNIVFGPEPLFSYLHAKEAEIKALRIIMISKINKLSPEVIRERLRDLYV